MTVNTVTIGSIRELLRAGKSPLLLDVRTAGEFARVHAVGARSMPLDALDPAAASSLRSDGDPLYVICHSGTRAAEACRRLAAAGVAPVYCVEGGTSAWEREGMPVERRDGGVISLDRQVRIAAGSLVFLGTVLSWLVHPAFGAIPAFVGAGLVFAGVTDFCGMALLLAKMPWNRRTASMCA